jgi:hypothetical protein
MFKLKTVRKIEKKLHINPLIIPPRDLRKGMLIEKEHSDITKGSALLSAKIAIAHVKEFPDYYKRLDKLEKKAKKDWSKKHKPNIFL